MSMSLHVYVGPFLKCYPRGACNPYDVTNGRLTNLRGENEATCFDAVGPNVEVPGIARPTTWERTGESESIQEPIPQLEDTAFFLEFANEMNVLREHYKNIELTWGVVPGWF